MSNQLLDDREKRTIYRKLAKSQLDQILTLDGDFNLSPGPTIRLLDEGAIVDSFGDMDAYITKGTLKEYVDSLDSRKKFAIDLGHNPFSTFPFILGEWSKEDLTLVDIGDGRQGLDVTLHLDYDSIFIKELQRMPYEIGVSAEFHYRLNMEATEEYAVPVINKVEIYQLAIVGECGNVNSDGMKLKGGENVSAIKRLMGLEEKPEEEKEVTQEPEEQVAEETTEEVSTEETAVEEQATEEQTAEEAEETAAEPEETAGDDVLQEMLSTVKALTDENTEQKEQIEFLAAKVESLEEVIAGYKQRDESFMESMKELKLSLNPDMKGEKIENDSQPRYQNNDGKGVLA